MSERRFTDREVGRILQRASELDRDEEGRPAGRGLTLAQLQEVGQEAGIPPQLVARAATELHRGRSLWSGSLLGPPPVRRETRAVPAALSREELGHLVRMADDQVPAQGTAVETLGAVRWTARGRLLSRQIALEPSRDQTVIRVEERHEDRVPLLVQGLPTAYGGMVGAVLALEVVGGAAGLVAAVLVTGVAWVLGRVGWEAMSARSAARVTALADALAEEASRRTGGGTDAVPASLSEDPRPEEPGPEEPHPNEPVRPGTTPPPGGP